MGLQVSARPRCARMLAQRQAGTINNSGDVLRQFAPPDARDHLGAGSTYRAAAALTTSYLEMGAPRVLFDYVFEGVEKLAIFRRGLPSNASVYVFTLWAPVDEIIHREATREGRDRLGNTVLATYNALSRNLKTLGFVVSNTETAEAVAQTILDEIARSERTA